MNRDDRSALTCSFCGNKLDEVRELIVGPTVYICDECTKVGFDLISERIRKEESPRSRVEQFAPRVHGSELAARAQQFADSCDRAVELPRPVAERARALAEELELLASSKAGSRAVLTEYALGVMVMARSFATACDALELPEDVAWRARTVADEIKVLVPPRVSPSRAKLRVHHVRGGDMKGDSRRVLTCSFCGKSQQETRVLVAGAKGNVCDECIQLCVDIILGQVPKDESGRDLEVPATLPRGRVSALSLHASELAVTARLFADSCDATVDLPRPVAERARALAEEIELFASSKADSRTFLTEYALGVMVMARHFASACDAVEVPGHIAQRTRTLADEIETLFPPPASA